MTKRQRQNIVSEFIDGMLLTLLGQFCNPAIFSGLRESSHWVKTNIGWTGPQGPHSSALLKQFSASSFALHQVLKQFSASSFEAVQWIKRRKTQVQKQCMEPTRNAGNRAGWKFFRLQNWPQALQQSGWRILLMPSGGFHIYIQIFTLLCIF